jgi:hypothetical protein
MSKAFCFRKNQNSVFGSSNLFLFLAKRTDSNGKKKGAEVEIFCHSYKVFSNKRRSFAETTFLKTTEKIFMIADC